MHRRTLVVVTLGAGLLTSCGTIRKVPARMMADTMSGVVEAVQANPDPETVREGMPTLLLLIDGMIAKDPGNPDLLRQGALTYGAYCQSFLMEPQHEQRARRMFFQARRYGVALLRTYPEMDAAFSQRQAAFDAALQSLGADDTDNLFAAGSAWLGWILANSGSMDAVADLPRAMAVVDRLQAIDPNYGDGVLHTFYGVLYAAQPRGAGQDLARSRSHFEKAIALAGPHALTPRVAMAEYLGRATLDEDLFTRELNAVIAADLNAAPNLRLANTLAQDRAHYLLDNMQEWF